MAGTTVHSSWGIYKHFRDVQLGTMKNVASGQDAVCGEGKYGRL